MYPYKIVHELFPRNYEARQLACEKMLVTLLPTAVIFFLEKAHFHLSEYVNKQTMRLNCLQSDKVTVWCTLSKYGIVGPYVFEEGKRTIPVNSTCYLAMIQDFFLSELDEFELKDVWFQQDEATVHTVRIFMDFLRARFSVCIISLSA